MQVHHISNINRALAVLQECGLKLVNISSNDIVSGNTKLTLGLVWLIALSFNGQKLVNSQAVSGIEKSLLNWVRQITNQHGVKINDFSSSWSDGSAFLYILHQNVPQFDLNSALKLHPIARLRMAFDLASRHLQIDQLLDPEDVNTNRPDKKSILMYVMCLYHAIDSKKMELGSIQNLAQHFGSLEEMQLLDEERKSGEFSETIQSASKENKSTDKLDTFHVGNLTRLDEISLAKSVENLSKFLPPLSHSRGTMEDVFLKPKVEETVTIHKTEYSAGNFFIDSKSRPVSTATNFSIEIGGYQSAVEEGLTLLLEAEEVLSKELPIVTELNEAKEQFHEHEDFMLKLAEHQQYVGTALEEGARLISESQSNSGLTIDEQNEIKHQMFLLNERWETLRFRALDTQSKIHANLAKVQFDKIEELRVFLTSTEDRISRMAEIGPGPNELKDQFEEHKTLQQDLEEQQKLVDSLANLVVIVDDDSENFADLEDRLSALGERWSHVVKWTKIRWEKLQELSIKWTKMNEYYRILTNWMDSRERDVKAMEGKEVTEMGSIMKRMKDLRYCENDLFMLVKYLQELEQIVASLPNVGLNLTENIENLSDRCEALSEMLEVQQNRLESMGFQKSNETVLERPFSWEDFQSKFNESTEAMDVSKEEQFDPELSPQSNKKRKLQKPKEVVKLDEKITEIFSFIDDCDLKLGELQRYSLTKQSNVLDELNSDLKKRIQEYPDVKNLLDNCKNLGECNLSLEENQLSDIGSKYDETNFRLDDLITNLRKDVMKDKFYKSLTAFKLILADSRDWYKQHANSSTREELELRLKNMESLTPEINGTREICTSEDDFKEWSKDFDLFHESWVDMKQAVIRQIQEKGGMDEISEMIKELDSFIDQTDEYVHVVDELNKMESNLEKLNGLKLKYQSFDEIYKYVLANRDSSSMEDLKNIWDKVPIFINEKIIKQSTSIENLNHFNTEYENIVKFLTQIDSSLKKDDFILGEIKPLQKKLKEYEKYSTEIKKIQIDISSVKNFSEIIVKDSDDDYGAKMDLKLKKLADSKIELENQLEKNRENLNKTITETESILSRVHETELWLNDLEMNTPKNQNAQILNSNELFQIKTKFQTLKETCEQMTIKFRELNEAGSEILLQIDELIPKTENKVSYLAKKFTKLNARWNEVTSLVYTRTALLEHVSSQLGEFKTLVASEGGYLDKLEKLLRKSPESAADAEEISEELDVSIFLVSNSDSFCKIS